MAAMLIDISTNRRRRGAALYITVLGTAMIVTVGALTVLEAVRTNARRAAMGSDTQKANLLAFSAIEHALTVINTDTGWRTTYSHGVTGAQFPLGDGTCAWVIKDASLPTTDGDLADDPTDSVRIYGIGTVGDSTRVLSLLVEPVSAPLDVLRTAAHTAGDFNANYKIVASGGPLSSNTVFQNSGEVTGDIEAPLYTGFGDHDGTFTQTPAKEMPAASVFDDIYLPMATEIPYDLLPRRGANRKLTGTLSAAANPFAGFANPNGVYHVVVPWGKTLHVQDFNFTGTLLVTMEPGTAFLGRVGGTWQPARPDFPTLVIRGANDKWIELSATHSGLIHVIGDGSFLLGGNFNLIGTVVSDAIFPAGPGNTTPTLTADPNLFANPPRGYESTQMLPVPHTYQWSEFP